MPISRLKQYLNLNPSKPERVFWWFSLICNLKCNHCGIGKKTSGCGIRQFKEMSLGERKKILDKLSKWLGRGYSLSFIAGEPLLHKDMLEVLSYASKSGAVTSITSNGTLIYDKEKAEKIVRSGLSYIALSLDGWNSGIHDKSRGVRGVKKRLIKAVALLREAKENLSLNNPKIYINSIIMKDNLNDLLEIVEWVKKERIDGITFQPIAANEFFGGNKDYEKRWYESSELWPDKKKVMKFLDKLEELRKNGYRIMNSNNDFRRFRLYFKDPEEFASTETCESELKSMVITEEGRVKICPGLKEDFGSVINGNLGKMWKSWVAWKARQHVYTCKSQCKILANNKEDFYF